MPGYINAHMHFYSTLVRGLGKAKPSANFVEVLENLWWKLDKILTPETNYYSAVIMLLNSIRKGTTTLIDHHASPMAVRGSLMQIAKAVKESGLRASLCYEVSDRDGEKIAQEGLDENAEFIKYCNGLNDSRLKALFGLHASFTINDNTLAKAAELGKSLNSGFHIHSAEASSDEEHCEKTHKMRVIERLNKFGILGKNSIAAHCVHVNEKEIDLLAETDTIVVHNPQSNMNNAVGIADVIKLLNKGVKVGLGTDAMTVNMPEELRVGLWAQHLRNENPTCGFMEMVSLLLNNNPEIASRHFGVPLGKIEENAAADVILVDYFSPTPLDENTYLGHIVFGLSQATVDTTIASGKILMENKILKLDIDEEELNRKACDLTVDLWNRF
jgi:putative selenium metabolism protein SsnA